MATLIPTAYLMILGGRPGTRVEIIAHGEGWAAYTASRHLARFSGPGSDVWERDSPFEAGPHIFRTAQEAADAAENARWP